MTRAADIFLGTILGITGLSGSAHGQSIKAPPDARPAADYPELAKLLQASEDGMARAAINLSSVLTAQRSDDLALDLTRELSQERSALCRQHRVEACPPTDKATLAANREQRSRDMEDMDDDQIAVYLQRRARKAFTLSETVIDEIAGGDREQDIALKDSRPELVSHDRIVANVKDMLLFEAQAVAFRAATQKAVEDEAEAAAIQTDANGDPLPAPAPPAADTSTVTAGPVQDAHPELTSFGQRAFDALFYVCTKIDDTLHAHPEGDALTKQQLWDVHAAVSRLHIGHPATPIAPEPPAELVLSAAELRDGTAELMNDVRETVDGMVSQRSEVRGSAIDKDIVLSDVNNIQALEQLNATLARVLKPQSVRPPTNP